MLNWYHKANRGTCGPFYVTLPEYGPADSIRAGRDYDRLTWARQPHLAAEAEIRFFRFRAKMIGPTS